MSFFSTLGDMLESALGSIADGINKIGDAIPSPSDSSPSRTVVHTSARDALRRAAEKESAIALRSFFRKYQIAVVDAEIDELVSMCLPSPDPGIPAKFDDLFLDTPEMRNKLAEVDAVNAEIERLQSAGELLQTLVSRNKVLPVSETEDGVETN